MKEAIIINNEGIYVGPIIVSDDFFGASPVYEAQGLVEIDEKPEELQITGYTIAERVPEGLFLPKWDFVESRWVEGLSAEEIEAIRNAPQPESPQQQIEKLVSDLDDAMTQLVIARDDNLTLMEAVAELYEMLLAKPERA
ncbi:hypothetical protein [Cohnella nanjingensis]|uniref:Bacteriophage SP-beta YorD domain-containing protein n=1 Tax=Cohnella nanjingensis TaxID=1387779 RepID=A0A7X0VI18_9BACL|nr:hypothetical protein [Cohnella nanjingensis]MBB6674501.1 hypothetical protein [Cohnella nanjingensis]